jgi:alkylation response protein AidB-like acyl-CoA dehydrogenase
MTLSSAIVRQAVDPFERIKPLLPQFTARAAEYDAHDTFAAENYAALKEIRLMSAAVPAEFGGDGLQMAELSQLLRTLASACSATGLAYAMHTHVLALIAWRWRRQKAPVDAFLKRVAAEQLVLISSGGSDWLDSSGTARRVEGGFLIDAVKAFASGVPAGDLLNTSAVYDDPQAGPTALHFMVPLTAKEVTIEPSWRAMGMRATGSHVVRIKDFFVPDAAVGAKRPRGKWHPLFHLVSMIAIPLVYSAYLGVADAARAEALALARRRPATPQLIDAVGAMETELAAARAAHADMLAAAEGEPGPATTNRIFLGRTNVVRGLLATFDRMFEITHGAGYLRTSPIERLFRDVQAARFHPLAPAVQRELSGRLALGLAIDAVA